MTFIVNISRVIKSNPHRRGAGELVRLSEVIIPGETHSVLLRHEDTKQLQKEQVNRHEEEQRQNLWLGTEG